MYTGIITGTFPITALEERPGAATFAVELDARHLEDLGPGASVGIEGVCMTVTRITGNDAWFDASIETLRRTTLGQLTVGQQVNIERSAKAGAEVGGHPISGHIDGMAEVVAVEFPENNCILTVRLPAESLRYVFNKGFIALNGCSLTVSELDKATGEFKVYLIPETLRLTTFKSAQPGGRLNYEIDRQTQIIVDTIREAVTGVLGEMRS